jgi:AraC-like DNA-binding protein
VRRDREGIVQAMSAQVSDAGAPVIPLNTTDAGVAMDYFRNAYGTSLTFSGLRDGPVYAHTRLDAGVFALDDVRVPGNMAVRVDPLNTLLVVQLDAGKYERQCGGVDEAFRPGDVFVDAEPRLPATLRSLEIHVQTMKLDLPVLAQVATSAAGSFGTRAPGPIRFTGYQPVSVVAAANWKRTTQFLRELLTNPEAATQPLIMGNAARLLAATALSTFPNTAVHEPAVQDRTDATAATLRRAIAFIEQHPDTDVSVADIAAAAHVSIRTIQFAFRRHLDTTPMEYLRSVRLDRVHRELLTADPSRGATVTDIAIRWGFYNHSRFASRYHRAYGVKPAHTLRGGAPSPLVRLADQR